MQDDGTKQATNHYCTSVEKKTN